MNKVVLIKNCTKKSLILVCLMMIFSLFSCSNMLLNNDLSQIQDEVLITFSINYGDSYSRTILPESFSLDDKTNYFFKIIGRSSRGETIEKIFEANQEKTITLSHTMWELSLEFYENTGNQEVLLMNDTISEDFSYGIHPITFSLSDKKVSTEGGCDLTFTFTNDSVNTVKIDLLDISTGNSVFSSNCESADIKTVEEKKTVIYQNEKIARGQYILRVIFYNSNKEVLACWSDILFISSGINTNKTISIPENIFGTIPNSPTNVTGEPESNILTLNWEDNSTNENQFNIYVYKDGELVNTYYSFAGTTSYSIYLEAGNYEVIVSAKNKLGETLSSSYSITIN